ncbi:putative disease resistance protein [Acorus calamus]|uniref:Disease resistance protein n=1 Tax=Acorus calamus TaxID=4465 RepID=A0AAV9DR99_ACOCL|nr:putative disease resistance protein [Acorus calamus]
MTPVAEDEQLKDLSCSSSPLEMFVNLERMVDAVVGIFLDKLINALASEGRKVIEFRDAFENMKSQLYLLQSFLKDAEKSKRKDHIVRALVDGLRELIHEAEDILADCQLQASKQKQT